MKTILLVSLAFLSVSATHAGEWFQEHYSYQGKIKTLPGTWPLKMNELKDSLYNQVVHIKDVSCDDEFVSDVESDEFKSACDKFQKMPIKTYEQKMQLVSSFKRLTCKNTLSRTEAFSKLDQEEQNLQLDACYRGPSKLPATHNVGRAIASVDGEDLNKLSKELESAENWQLYID